MSICSKCGGECCKEFPGIFHPEDFQDVEKEYTKQELVRAWLPYQEQLKKIRER